MNNLCWNIFKKTGSIEAFLYLSDFKNMDKDNNNDNLEHPGDSS